MRPFVAPYVSGTEKTSAGADDSGRNGRRRGTVELDLTPRLVAYFEVTILPKEEGEGGEKRRSDGVRRPVVATLTPRRAVAPPDPVPARLRPPMATLHRLGYGPPFPIYFPLARPLVTAAARLDPGDRDHDGQYDDQHNQDWLRGWSDPVAAASDCIAVGVSTSSFRLKGRMPGWDRHSYGYHGDDGGAFHAGGDMERLFGPKFGGCGNNRGDDDGDGDGNAAADTVGCGVDYVKGGIFFTLNGRFLGYGWTDVSDVTDPKVDLYPTVGIDSSRPIACNFGERPFEFDLGGFARQYGEMVRESLEGLGSSLEGGPGLEIGRGPLSS